MSVFTVQTNYMSHLMVIKNNEKKKSDEEIKGVGDGTNGEKVAREINDIEFVVMWARMV